MKSWYSVGNGACVCWEERPDGTCQLWDSKRGEAAPRWAFTPRQWHDFCGEVLSGALSKPMALFYLDDAVSEVEVMTLWLDGNDQAWRRSDSPVVMRFTSVEIHAFVRAVAMRQPAVPDWQPADVYYAGLDAEEVPALQHVS